MVDVCTIRRCLNMNFVCSANPHEITTGIAVLLLYCCIIAGIAVLLSQYFFHSSKLAFTHLKTKLQNSQLPNVTKAVKNYLMHKCVASASSHK